MVYERSNRYYFLALAILVLAAYFIRIPGYYWGYHKINKGRLIVSHMDEDNYAKQAAAFINNGEEKRKNYLVGFLRETHIFLKAFAPDSSNVTPEEVLFGARLMNIIFSVLTVIVIYYLSLNLFSNRAQALLSSFAYAFYPLSVIHSHYATPLASFVFWFWLALFCFYEYTKSHKIWIWYFAWIATAFACATKFGFVLLVPGIILLYRDFIHKKQDLGRIPITLVIAVIVYQYLNYWYPPSFFYQGLVNGTMTDNFFGREHNRWINPIIYAIILIPSISIAGFVFTAGGLIIAIKKKFFDLKRLSNLDRMLTIELPLAIQLIITLLLTATFERHLLVFLPYLSILSGFFLVSAFKKKESGDFSRLNIAIVIFLMLYNLIVAANLEYQHYNSRLYLAENWLQNNIKEDDKVYFPSQRYYKLMFQDGFLKSHMTPNINEAKYVVATESMTWRLGSSVMNISNPTSDINSVFNPNVIDDASLTREILSNSDKYEKVLNLETEVWVPEYYLFKKFFHNFNVFAGDVWIYKIKG